MSDNIARQPKGRPTGGQFAATAKSEPELDSLAVADAFSDSQPATTEQGQPEHSGSVVQPATEGELREALTSNPADSNPLIVIGETKQARGTTGLQHFYVQGGTVTNPRAIHNAAGFHSITTLDGRTEVHLDSPLDNILDVAGQAESVITIGSGRKASIDVSEDAVVFIDARASDRVRVQTHPNDNAIAVVWREHNLIETHSGGQHRTSSVYSREGGPASAEDDARKDFEHYAARRAERQRIAIFDRNRAKQLLFGTED